MAKSPTDTLRFTRLRLTNWRNFRSVDVALSSRAFLVGPNASGKSNFLDAIRFLSEIARPASGGLQAAVKERGGFSALRSLHARRPSHIEIMAEIGTDKIPSTWKYVLRINATNKQRSPTVQQETVTHHGVEVINEIQKADDDDLIFSQTSLEQVKANEKFRELSGFLGSCRYLHVVPQIVRDRRRAHAEGDDPYGGDLLRRMKAVPKKTLAPRLARIGAALRLAVPQFQKLELVDDAEGVPHLIASFEHWRATASQQSEVVFSDGTLRLIGLLWSVAEKGGPLLLEEPELSLNDAVVSELPGMFVRMQRLSGRQVIVTTHSSALLDDTGLGLTEVHRISVDENGSQISRLGDDEVVKAQVGGGLTIGQAVLPLIRPRGIEQLGKLDVTN